MSEVTVLQDCTWRAIEAVNAIVECDDTFEERHLAIEHVKKHLEARAEQCKPKDDIGFLDLLGGFGQ
jgi:hypothetical protein